MIPQSRLMGDLMRGDFRSTEILNQLEEIQAAQRHADYYRQQQELDYGLRMQREHCLRQYLEECE
jgi:hypothetical protein